MSDRDGLRELMAAVALGAADPEEVERVERAADEDPELARELAGLRAAAGSLAMNVPQVDPPSRLRENLMAEVRADAAPSATAERPSAEPAPEPRRRWWLRPWAVAAAAAAAALGLLVWNVTALDDDAPQVTEISVRGTAEAPGARADLRVLPDEEGAILQLFALPEPPEGRRYELWVIRSDGPVSAGFLAEGAVGFEAVALTDLEGATAVAVTAEPPGNTRAPTAAPVVEIPLATA